MADRGTGRMADTPQRYGVVSRAFHWIAAYLLVWQCLMVVGWRVLGDGAFMRTTSGFGPAHATVGVLVLVLVVPRLLWAFTNRDRRPPADAPPLGMLARVVYGLFYLLMTIVPGLALVRAYGSGKGYALWGMQLVPVTGREIPGLKAPADLLHAPLAWLLAALIAGHILMAFFHSIVLKDGTMRRML